MRRGAPSSIAASSFWPRDVADATDHKVPVVRNLSHDPAQHEALLSLVAQREGVSLLLIVQ